MRELLTAVRRLIDATEASARAPLDYARCHDRAVAWEQVRRVCGGRVPLGQVERVCNEAVARRLGKSPTTVRRALRDGLDAQARAEAKRLLAALGPSNDVIRSDSEAA